VLDEGPFFHGTKADLRVGDLLTAGFRSNYRPDVVMNHIYFTALPDGAGLAAELAAGEGAPRVYAVEPTGAFENDPNVTDMKFTGTQPGPTAAESHSGSSARCSTGHARRPSRSRHGGIGWQRSARMNASSNHAVPPIGLSRRVCRPSQQARGAAPKRPRDPRASRNDRGPMRAMQPVWMIFVGRLEDALGLDDRLVRTPSHSGRFDARSLMRPLLSDADSGIWVTH